MTDKQAIQTNATKWIQGISLFVFLIVASLNTKAQTTKTDYIWDGRLLNHPTTTLPFKGQNQIYVVHYFSSLNQNGFEDMFGIYGTANIQMGIEHGFSDKFSAFFLTEKVNKTQELGFRYSIVQQDIEGINPVGMSLSFSIAIDGRNKRYFGENYYFINRCFYTTQFSLTRQLNHLCELMVNSTFSHFNMVPEGYFSTYMSLNPSFAIKLSRKKALFASVDLPLGIASASEADPEQPSPIISLGAIFKSRTHNFQLFVSNGGQIIPGKEYLNNTKFDWNNFCFGFNINVKTSKHK
ncbi:DUF5777 family beta-barrel protein [Plebeiibacterium sediminum]|uniref:DUF5777 family beta-barrel protein n=1 Tax=Plebeiibacterium sediminum TaxID=2992112 RepID=A0AAE3M1D5_9BACT|nr:DUF5777 family beta-barrel protein [Plebeiobacterium sediminum]MCW3785329.1 DUF5777 family beta-barrel protein [Plebeiobacterium sediminum]